MPPRDKMIMLLLRADCLSGAAAEAIAAGDMATAARMTMEMQTAIKSAREIAERMAAQ